MGTEDLRGPWTQSLVPHSASSLKTQVEERLGSVNFLLFSKEDIYVIYIYNIYVNIHI